MNEKNQRFARYKRELLAIIHNYLPDCKVYLFGSRARKTHQSGSDVDLALDCGASINFDIIVKIHNDIEKTTIPLTVDLVDLYGASETLKKEVKEEGIAWEN